MGGYDHFCRWCQKPYRSKRYEEKDGFCSSACKMALHRAYKNYVTHKDPGPGPIAAAAGNTGNAKKGAKNGKV